MQNMKSIINNRNFKTEIFKLVRLRKAADVEARTTALYIENV